MCIVLDESESDDDDEMDGLGLGADWGPLVERGPADWLGGPDPRSALGSEMDAPVDDLGLVGVGNTPDPAGEEEKEVVIGGDIAMGDLGFDGEEKDVVFGGDGMCQYIYVRLFYSRI